MVADSLLWLTRYGPEGASSRYRVLQYVEPLGAMGFAGPMEPLANWQGSRPDLVRGVSRRIRRIRAFERRPADADVVVLQKEPVMPPALGSLIRGGLSSISDRMIWDIDDAIWLGRHGAMSLAEMTRRRARRIVAGNNLLAEWAAVGTAEVFVVPTCFTPSMPVRLDVWPVDDDPVRIAWIGSPASAALLERYGPLISQLLRYVPHARLELVGGFPPAALRGHPRVSTIAWSREAEHKVLHSADFGLALQPRSTYADHKCGFKIVQYLAYGVTPIASDNPVHRSLLDGEGLLVRDGGDAAELASLVSDKPTLQVRRRLRDRWRTNYSVEVGLGLWARVLGDM